MNHTLLPLLVGAGVIGFVILLIGLAIKAGNQARQRMAQLAANLGLTLEPPQVTLGLFHSAPRVSGERRGKWTEIYTYSTGAGKSRTTWSALSAKPGTDGGLTFALSRAGFGSKLAELFGSREIQVGDPAFDAAWFIQTNRPEYFGAALLPEVRAKLDGVARTGSRGTFKLEHGKIVYAERGGFFDASRCARFEQIADVVGDLADVAEVHASGAGR